MADSPYLWLVGTRCAADLEEEFNKWYDEVHIPMLTTGGHITAVNRYKLSDVAKSDEAPYLAVYEFKNVDAFKSWLSSQQLADARKEMSESWGGRDMEIESRAFYEPVSHWS